MSLNVVVVGAGVIGAAVAADLARGGCSVTVLESGQVAAGTSGATFAWTNAGGKQPRSYFDLNVRACRPTGVSHRAWRAATGTTRAETWSG